MKATKTFLYETSKGPLLTNYAPLYNFPRKNGVLWSLLTASKNLYCKVYNVARENNPLLLFSNSYVQIFCAPPPIEIFILPIFKGHSSSDVLFRIGCTCIIIVYSRSKSIIATQMGLYSLVQLDTYFYFTFMYIAIEPGFDSNLFAGYTFY